MTTVTAIPTTYRCVQFRSRLEARWAALFDLLQWPWEYEPFDLAGYIPDFQIRFPAPILVEVKPVSFDSTDEDFDLVVNALQKVKNSGWQSEALLLGGSPLERADSFGLLTDYSGVDMPSALADLRLCGDCRRITPHRCTVITACRWCNGCEDQLEQLCVGMVGQQLLRAAWNYAGSMTQWKGAA